MPQEYRGRPGNSTNIVRFMDHNIDNDSFWGHNNYMNKLTSEKRAMILAALTDGMSVSATSRICGVNRRTIMRLIADAGSLARDLHELHVTDLVAIDRLEFDEIWQFVGCKEKSKKRGKQGIGDVWCFTAFCPTNKLIVDWLVGSRDSETATAFAWSVADRLNDGCRPQITTDSLAAYRSAIASAFGSDASYCVLQKIYAAPDDPERRYSPSVCVGSERHCISGSPDESKVSTSGVERSNLSIRTMNKRYARLTNCYSRKMALHVAMLNLTFLAYNFCKRHSSLNGQTPAQAAGITAKPWTMLDVAKLLESEEGLRTSGGRLNKADQS